MSITPRERVLASLSHQQPDRVPLDMMGNASMLIDETYLRLRDYLKLTPIPPVRSGSTANYYDERILEYFDIDFRRIFLKEKSAADVVMHDDGSYTDVWGVRCKKEGPYIGIVEHPLCQATTAAEVDAYRWPKAEEMFSAEGLAAQAKQAYEKTGYALVARNPFSRGFLDRGVQLMGMAEFFMAMELYPDAAACVVEHVLGIYKETYRMFLDAVGPYVQMVEVSDDLGTQQSLLISPDAYRRFIKPADREFYALIRQKAPKAALFRHVDGAIFPVIPDLIEVGVRVFNPVQTSVAGMDARRLKQAYGGQITFHGAVEKLANPVDELVSEVKERIDVLAPGGGYVLASCNYVLDVSPENIIAMFDTAREYSRRNP